MARKHIAIIGGGTGTHTVLRGLKRYQKQVALSAIVTMADSGGSTGRLRDEFGYLPVGDVRMALAALASDIDEHEELLRELFLYRFDKGNGLSGHNFGNLLLVALTDILGSEEAAIKAAARVLRVQGTVVPVTTQNVDLVATYADGVTVVGEHAIDEPTLDRYDVPITHLAVTPSATISASAEAVLLEADLIVLGPGDLYTSVLANCVVDGVADAIRHSKAKVVYVCNLMTKVGQTSGMGVAEHVSEIAAYIKKAPDIVLVHTGGYPTELLAKYAKDREYPVIFNYEATDSRIIPGDMLASEMVKVASGDRLKRSFIRHDSRTLARKIMDIV
jgi:uncharacterized cofD-like protein